MHGAHQDRETSKINKMWAESQLKEHISWLENRKPIDQMAPKFSKFIRDNRKAIQLKEHDADYEIHRRKAVALCCLWTSENAVLLCTNASTLASSRRTFAAAVALI